MFTGDRDLLIPVVKQGASEPPRIDLEVITPKPSSVTAATVSPSSATNSTS
jgi:hypothetical protein